MSIAAIANVAFNGRLRALFHADPVIEAAELLLQEKAPREIPVMSAKYEPQTPGKGQADLLRAEIRTVTDPATKDRELVFLSNGHYSVMLTATGSGYSRWNGQSQSVVVGNGDPALWRRISARHRIVRPVPTLLIHGALDSTLDARQSERFAAALIAAGAPAETLLIPELNHVPNLAPPWAFARIDAFIAR
eukprot:gene5690-7524_t